MSNINLDIQQKLCLAKSFSNHPIKNESIEYKIKYVNALEWFVNKFSHNDLFAYGMLENYKSNLLESNISSYSYNDDIENNLSIVAKLKFRPWHIFSYRYTFLIDILFLCAFDDLNKGKLIINEYKKHLRLWFQKNKYYQKMDVLNNCFYEYFIDDDIKLDAAVNKQISDWQTNLKFYKQKPQKILITANMSAGKSTLINALAGKKIVKTRNMACTSKLHYIYNKAFEDGFSYKIDGYVSLNAHKNFLLNNNVDNTSNEISASTYFRSSLNKPICLIDTPGVNNSESATHKTITQEAILEKEYDKLIYVMNAEYLGTNDEYKHLNFIAENVKDKEIIVAINKLDSFNAKEDNIAESVRKILEDLNKFKLKNFKVSPISAYAGLLAKEKLWQEEMDEFDIDELELLCSKLRKDTYNLLPYYGEISLNSLNKEVTGADEKYANLLGNCGILPLEKIISQ